MGFTCPFSDGHCLLPCERESRRKGSSVERKGAGGKKHEEGISVVEVAAFRQSLLAVGRWGLRFIYMHLHA